MQSLRNIGSKIGDGIGRVMDWAMEGSMPWSLTKLLGVSAAALGVIASPFILAAYINANALENRFEDLDNSSYTHVFNSVAGCMEEGFTQEQCLESKKEALEIAEELGTTLSYSSKAECLANHQSCEKHVTPVTTYTKVGDVSIPNTTYVTTYQPPVVAWQAAADNIEESVPLYQGPTDDIVVRKDGRQFNAPTAPQQW